MTKIREVKKKKSGEKEKNRKKLQLKK